MALVKHHKHVASLPTELEPDAIYYVRSGGGVDVYVTNGSGLIVAYKVNTGGGSVNATINLDGPTSLYISQSAQLQITDFNAFSDYVVQVSAGIVSLDRDTITFAAPDQAQDVTLTVSVDGADRSFSIEVMAAGVATPSNVSPADGATEIDHSPTLQSSAFATYGLEDTHSASRWRLYQAGSLVHDSDWVDSLVVYRVPVGALQPSLTFSWTVEHRGASLGDSMPSAPTGFSTSAAVGGLIGAPGTQGFGIGVCPDAAWLTTLGLSEMTGTTDKTHVNYGNYQHVNGSVVGFIPKFFYRLGSASSPVYGTYGANSCDVVGIETFVDEAAANAAGYALHRAFINNGVEVPGFFIDKYLASKDGASSCKSVRYGAPISLTTSAGYTSSNGMAGCTGILADAVVLARARGTGWNGELIFQRDALARISLAHAQYSSGTAHCAWYDATGTSNFPKGCNNGALADTNDASVTFVSAGDSATTVKPQTGSASNLAKTTHNGQENGIADVNGAMYQVLLGVTQAGTSGTDTSSNGTGTAYVIKRAARHADLTGGYGGATDAWGSSGSLANNFDAITGFLPWLSATGWNYFGNGANQVFSGALSGTDYLRTCCGIGLQTGMGTAGTSQFGNDGNYRYTRANQVPLAAGYWINAASAGVFYRFWIYNRSVGDYFAGFRCAAYGN